MSTGEYRALSATASGPFSKVDPTLTATPRPVPSLRGIPLPAASSPGGVAAPDGAPLNVATPALLTPSLTPSGIGHPSVTPMLDSAGGGSISVPGEMQAPDFRRGNRKGVIFAVASVAALGALVALSMRSGPSPAATTTPSDVPPPPSAAPVVPPLPVAVQPVAPPPIAPAPKLSVHFQTDPPGASVKENNNELCPATPCDYSFSGDAAAEHKVVIARPGFRPETRVVHGSDAQVAVTLAAAKAWVAPVKPQGGGKPAEPGTAPQGFKDIPY
jgi:hypothetical protein